MKIVVLVKQTPDTEANIVVGNNQQSLDHSDTKFVVDYFRISSDYRLLFGGGENYTHRFPTDIKSFVRQYMLRVFPQLSEVGIDYAWG